ncbi:MAG: VOC family protein [Gammaproteobacteria bacterium]
MDRLDHVAIVVDDIDDALSWYHERFECETLYADATWALLGFANARLALVVADEHPNHVAITRANAADFGELTAHRDGTASTYITDPFGNAVEIMQAERPE